MRSATLIAFTFPPSCHVLDFICEKCYYERIPNAICIKIRVKKYHESYVGSSEIANNLLATFADTFGVES